MNWGFMVLAIIAAASMLAVFNWRRAPAVTRTLAIKCDAERVWQAVDPAAGLTEWYPFLDNVEIRDGGNSIILHQRMPRRGENDVRWQMAFDVAARDAGRRLRLERCDLEPGMGTNDRLLCLDISLEREGERTRVIWHEKWGPRTLTGQVLAHMDAASHLHRLRAWCETGAAHRPVANWAPALICGASLFATVAAFSLLLGLQTGLILVGLLVLHELGHLVSFKMIGQPWGKIVFMPFLGGVAVSRVPHVRLADDAFCAIMGAGLSLTALVPAIAAVQLGLGSSEVQRVAFAVAALAGALNLLNLLPVFPLDGGRVLRAVMQSIMPDHVRLTMFVMAGVIAIAGCAMANPVIVAIAAVAFLQSTRLGPPRAGVRVMDIKAVAVMLAAYVSVGAGHGAALLAFWPALVAGA